MASLPEATGTYRVTFGPSSTSSNSPIWDTTTSFGVSPCIAGHQANPNYAEYLDGEIATTCSLCGQRIVFHHLPGGVPLLRLKALLENLMSGDCDKTRALDDFGAITEALQNERLVLDAADALAALARTLLEQ